MACSFYFFPFKIKSDKLYNYFFDYFCCLKNKTKVFNEINQNQQHWFLWFCFCNLYFLCKYIFFYSYNINI